MAVGESLALKGRETPDAPSRRLPNEKLTSQAYDGEVPPSATARGGQAPDPDLPALSFESQLVPR